MGNKRYTVYVGGMEVNDNYVTEERALELSDMYEAQGYTDVAIVYVEPEVEQTAEQTVEVNITESDLEMFADLVYNNEKFTWSFPDQNGNNVTIKFVQESEDYDDNGE
tara:strand:+ start:2978 stop:3301 length:324 start_codon:yes stop_codon:yes gene_type:complete